MIDNCADIILFKDRKIVQKQIKTFRKDLKTQLISNYIDYME